MDARLRLSALALVLAVLPFAGSSVAAAQPPVVDCSTPRKAALTFLGNLQDDADHPEDAIRCFDWEGGGIERRSAKIEAARHLQAVLDQLGLYIDMDAIPDTPEVADEETDGGKIPLASRLPEIHLVKEGDEWVISGPSVHAIEGLYDETFTYDVQAVVDELPDWAKLEPLPGMALWQLLGLFLAFFGGMFVRFLVSRVLFSWVRRLLKARDMKFDFDVLLRAANPIGTLAMTAFLWWLIPLLRFSVRVNQVTMIALRVMAAAAAVMLVYRLVDFGADIFARRAEKTETKLDDQIVPLIRKSLKVFVVAVGFIFVLQNLDVDVGSLLAGVSLGGLAFTLAARDTVANLFGSISIFADQPFQVGDWVLIDGHEGVVEEVGMRSTRIRTFYDSVIAIPNSVVANAAVDNYGQRRYRRCLVTLGLTYDTHPEQMQAFVEGVRAILKANPKVRQDSYEVHFNNFGDSALEVLLYFFFKVESYSDEMKQRMNVFLEVMRLAEAIGVSFAFPTRTLHLDTRATETEIPGQPNPTVEDLAKLAAAFGPGGDRSRPDSTPLTSGFLAGDDTAKGSDAEAEG